MKTIGFIGCYDKTDFMMCVAKILTMLGKRVLVIDNTLIQKARYIVPVINPTKAYVTEFEGFDVSVGFEDYYSLKQYLAIQEGKEPEYDIALIDIDNIDSFEKFKITSCEKNYFVTSFDLCSLKKGLELLSRVKDPVRLTKILFSKNILKEDDDYLNFLSLGMKIVWNNDYRIYLPIDNGDQSAIIENQRIYKIGIKRLSSQYKDSLSYIVEDIASDVAPQEIKKIFKIIEKEV